MSFRFGVEPNGLPRIDGDSAMLNMKIAFLFLFILLSACTVQPIQQKFAQRFDSIELGQNEQLVRSVFPEAYRGGQQIAKSGQQIKVLEFKDTQYDDLGCGCFVTQTIHFYFYENKLVQWGEPQDWRDREPDIVIQDQRD